jgi:hypothetical protein
MHDVPCSTCGAFFFLIMACFVISNIVRFSRFFFLVIPLALQLLSCHFSPSYGLGLGVRGGPHWHLPFGSSLASFIFTNPFRFMMGSANCF